MLLNLYVKWLAYINLNDTFDETTAQVPIGAQYLLFCAII